MLCRVGAVEIWRILEINAPFLTPEELWPEAGPEAGAAVLGSHFTLPSLGRVEAEGEAFRWVD